MYPCCKMTPRLDGWWLVSEHDHCTCSPHMGAHEVGCGMTPDVKLDHLPGWDELVTAVTAIQQAEIDRLNATIQRVHDLAEWHETKAEKARHYPGGDLLAIMTKAAVVHDDAATRLRQALEGGDAS